MKIDTRKTDANRRGKITMQPSINYQNSYRVEFAPRQTPVQKDPPKFIPVRPPIKAS